MWGSAILLAFLSSRLQVLCALVDAIQNLKKSAIEIRRSEIQEQVQMMDRDQAYPDPQIL